METATATHQEQPVPADADVMYKRARIAAATSGFGGGEALAKAFERYAAHVLDLAKQGMVIAAADGEGLPEDLHELDMQDLARVGLLFDDGEGN